MLGSVCAVLMCLFVVVGCIQDLRAEGETSFERPEGNRSDFVFGIFNAFGLVAFAFGGHCVMPDIQATIEAEHPGAAKQIMQQGLLVAYTVCLVLYLAVAVFGYAAFGSTVSDFVIDDLTQMSSNALSMYVHKYFYFPFLSFLPSSLARVSFLFVYFIHHKHVFVFFFRFT